MKLLLFCISIIFIINCAAIGPAGGGPEDKKGPELKNYFPISGSINVKSKQQIQIIFSEPIDPNSIQASIKIIPETNFKTDVRKNILYINPIKVWEKNNVTRLTINRELRDLRGNTMDSPIDITFSTSNRLNNGYISGYLINKNYDTIYKVGLFEYPPRDTMKLISTTQANESGKFEFNYLDNNKFFIVACNHDIKNIIEEIKLSSYGIITSDFIEISNQLDSIETNIFIDDPLPELIIQSGKLLGQKYGKLYYSDGKEEYFYFDSTDQRVFPTNIVISELNKDTIQIKSKLKNRLINYYTNSLNISKSFQIDNTPPILLNYFIKNNELVLTFNEPVFINNNSKDMNAFYFDDDSIQIPIDLINHNPFSITSKNVSKDINNFYLNENSITDLNGKNYPDSLISYTFNVSSPSIVNTKKIYGQLSGKISNFKKDVIIKVTNIENNSQEYTKSINNEFKFKKLNAGKYNILAYEILNEEADSIYFSGTISPYNRAAKFAIYPEEINIRGRWEREGINIRF